MPDLDGKLCEARDLRLQGDLGAALNVCRALLRENPAHPRVLHLLGIIAFDKNEITRAIDLLRRAANGQPSSEFSTDLGIALVRAKQLPQAAKILEEAIGLDPARPQAYAALGILWTSAGRSDLAAAVYQRALEAGIREKYILGGLAAIHVKQGKIEDALQFARTILNDAEPVDFSGFLYTIHYPSGIPAETIFDEHRLFADRFEAPLLAAKQLPNTRIPDRPLRVGYLSPDFCRHPVPLFFRQVAACHDPNQVEMFFYSALNPTSADDVTGEFRELAGANWREIFHLSDQAAAELVRSDAIDILVDLAGHAGHSRLLIFAHRPVPISITWLGYPDTTGLASMDYRITDEWADPPGMTEHLHTEELLRLPGGFLCFGDRSPDPEVGHLPARTAGHITFVSFNNFAKLSDATITAWTSILNEVGDAKLVLKHGGGADLAAREQFLARFAGAGIAAERIIIHAQMPWYNIHLDSYNATDIALDPFPYNGTTTSCEALWMGVPLVVLAGETHVARVGVSLMSQLEMTDWIAHTPDEYVQLAVRWARDPDGLERVRRQLRPRMKASALCNAPAFARKLEAAFRSVWLRWCESDTPQ